MIQYTQSFGPVLGADYGFQHEHLPSVKFIENFVQNFKTLRTNFKYGNFKYGWE